MTALHEVLTPANSPVWVADPTSATLISVRLHGKGAVRRSVGDGKQPKPFHGNRGRAGQFVFSRIWARRGAMAFIPRDLDGVVVTNEFPLFEIDSGRLNPGYFSHAVQTPRFLAELERISAGASGQNRVREAAFLGIDIELPPLEEQRRIAAILDQAEALRAKRRQVLAHLDTLTQSIFHDLFEGRSDTAFRLGSVTDAEDRINYGVVQPGDHVSGGVPLIRVSNLMGGRVDRTSLKRIESAIETGYARSRIRGTEILVSCVGTIGVVSVVSDDDVGSNVARAITRVPISDPVRRVFVAEYLRTPEAQRYFRRELRTVAQPTLNVRQLAAIEVPMPPAELLAEFARRLRSMEASSAVSRRSTAIVDELSASLQAHAFRGGL